MSYTIIKLLSEPMYTTFFCVLSLILLTIVFLPLQVPRSQADRRHPRHRHHRRQQHCANCTPWRPINSINNTHGCWNCPTDTGDIQILLTTFSINKEPSPNC